MGPGDSWLPANVAEPEIVTIAPTLQPGFHCSPCHAPAASQLFGVGETAIGPIAVGVEEPPAEAIAYSSADGKQWMPLPGFAATDGTAAVAVASAGSRTVIVGHDTNGAVAWVYDGRAWRQAPNQDELTVPYGGGAMTSVVGFGSSFVAGGYRDDPLHGKASAAVWRSTDGMTWHVDVAGSVFAGGRIEDVAVAGQTIVAVGTSGDPNYGPAAAWRWTVLGGWQRATIAPDSGGAMRAVTTSANGFLAVGLNAHDDGALAWISRDGTSWTAVPNQPAFHYFSDPVRMQSVVADSAGFLAGGWRSDAGNGSAVAWTSVDGLTWSEPEWVPSFSGGQITGLVVAGGAAYAVGRTGYPDNNQATIWIGSAP